MNTAEEMTTMRISKSNAERIAKRGIVGEVMNDVLTRILDRLEQLEKEKATA